MISAVRDAMRLGIYLLVGATLIGCNIQCPDHRKVNLACPDKEWTPFEVKEKDKLVMNLKADAQRTCFVVHGTWSPSASDDNFTALGSSRGNTIAGLRAQSVVYKIEFPESCFTGAPPEVNDTPVKSAKAKWTDYPGKPVCFTQPASCTEPPTVQTRIHDTFWEDNLNTGGLCATLMTKSTAEEWLATKGPTPETKESISILR